MSSILKVDTIQTTAGAAPTTKDLGFAAGSVLQVVYGEYHTVSTSNFVSTVFAPLTTAQATITPKYSDSKILIHCNGTAAGVDHGYDMSWHLKRGSSWIGGNNNTGKGKTHASGTIGSTSNGGSEVAITQSFHYLDSPATTSATTYILGFQGGETATYYINRGTSANYAAAYNFYNSGGCTITLMEIAQ